MKINTDVTFAERKIGIGILIQNHLGIPLLAKFVPPAGSFSLDYGEFLDIIRGYMLGMILFATLFIESDSLLAIRSFDGVLITFLSSRLYHVNF